jgi:alkanesulfonate monooxygenase SsuD/methylene tetrahydromethanopterin reductase-like flavin-dependent oxidoreductase (luciferase family)
MITRFGSLYAGHVDLENIGLDGTPVNDRWYPDAHLNTVYDKTLGIVQAMDRLGYSTFWSAEHHFQREGYECIPNLLMLYVHLAHLTANIKFGCGFNIAPMWHPLRLAEDFAMADILTGGRVMFGLGRGYHSREVDTFGVPSTNTDSDANRELFEEQVDIIFQAFHQQSFSHHGKHYDLPPRVPYRGYELQELTLVPRPRTTPVECWQPIVSASQRALDFMAKHGIKGIIGGGAATGGAAQDVVTAWRDTLARHGRDTELGGDLIIGVATYIADTEARAIKEARKSFEENLKMFAPLGFVRGLTDGQIVALGDPTRARAAGLPTLEQGMKTGAWLCGPPERIIERLMELQDKYPGLAEVNVGCTVMSTTQKVIVEQLEWFAQEVMPTFTSQAAG